MPEQESTSPARFFHTVLPVVGKTVLRMGVAGSYGIDSADVKWAAGQGANYCDKFWDKFWGHNT